MTDPSLIDHGRQVPSDSPPVSDVALRGVAPALAQQVTLLTDDNGVRMLALAHHVPVIGRIGIVIRARLEGVMAAVHPVLDQRIAAGFPVEPQGHVACEAFQLAGED